MRNLLIRILIIVTILMAAGHVLAYDLINSLDDPQNAINTHDRRILGNTTVNFVSGPFPDNATYYVYDSVEPVTVSASLNNKPYESFRNPWGWMITDVDSDKCSEKYIIWSTREATLNDHIFDICDSPITWLQTVALTQDQIDEDYEKPTYSVRNTISFKIGPEGTRIEPSQELDNISSRHRDLTWTKLHTYKLRFFNKVITANRYSFNAERTIVYMGSTASYVKDLSDTKLTAHKNENFTIKIDANSPKHNGELDYLQACHSAVTDITSSLPDAEKSNGGKPWTPSGEFSSEQVLNVIHYIRFNLSDALFKPEHTYSVETTCRYDRFAYPHVLYAGFAPDGGYQLTFNHKFAILPEPNSGNTVTAVILALTSHFLSDGSIHVQGKFDDSSPEQPAFKYAVKESASQTANWVAPSSVKWNPGNTNPANCPKCFSFVIPSSALQDKNKINLVQILPDVHSNEQAAHPDVATFTLQELINVGFVNAQGESWACGEENEVTPAKNNAGTSLIKMKLTVKRAVDNMTGNIWLPSLPVTYLGNGTVSYSAAGQTAAESKDISINENDKGKTAVNWAVNTVDKVLKPGVYILTLPINIPAYRREDVGPESLSLFANVYATKSILLKQRESSPDPDSVQCMDMFNDSAP